MRNAGLGLSSHPRNQSRGEGKGSLDSRLLTRFAYQRYPEPFGCARIDVDHGHSCVTNAPNGPNTYGSECRPDATQGTTDDNPRGK